MNDRDWQALIDLVTPLAYHPMRMAMDQRCAPRRDPTSCTACGRPRVVRADGGRRRFHCVAGCDLIPLLV